MTSPISDTKPPLNGSPQNDVVVLFGEVLADVFPERSVLGGAPFNVARHLQAFGCEPLLLSRVGDDALGLDVLATMTSSGMDTRGVQLDRQYPTGQVKVHLENGGHRFEILDLQAFDAIDPTVAHLVGPPQMPALVYYGTLAQRHVASRRALATLLDSTKASKFLDVNLRAPWYNERTLAFSLEMADIVKLNDLELQELADMFGLSSGDPHSQAMALMRHFDLAQVAVTCGAKGAWQMGRDGHLIESGVGHMATTVVDTVGAGDGFSAAYLLGTLRHWPTALTLERANAFAAAICGIRGAVPDDMNFYQPFSQAWAL